MTLATTSRRRLGAAPFLAFAAYVGAVLLPNLLIARLGIVDVAPGPWTLSAPAAVYAVGLGLVARDVLHEAGGTRLVLLGIGIGTVLSALLADPAVVVASAVAFVLAELLDLAVYVPLRRHGFSVAALGSSLVGLVLDSLAFLWIAFASLQFLPGQLVGKATAVLVSVGLVSAVRTWWRPRAAAPQPTETDGRAAALSAAEGPATR